MSKKIFRLHTATSANTCIHFSTRQQKKKQCPTTGQSSIQSSCFAKTAAAAAPAENVIQRSPLYSENQIHQHSKITFTIFKGKQNCTIKNTSAQLRYDRAHPAILPDDEPN